jgi:hypothetical protein
MQPIPLFRPVQVYDPDFLTFGIVNLVFERRKRIVRHG